MVALTIPVVSGLAERMESLYRELELATVAAAEADYGLYEAQLTLTARRAEILAGIAPKELGANEAQREANLQQVLAGELAAVQRWEGLRLQARGRLEIMRLRVEAARVQLRLVEVDAATRS